MVSPELGACEWFVWDLRRSNLIDRGQLDQTIGEFLTRNPARSLPALADFLVSEKVLTRFQADRILQGKVQSFVLGPFTLTDSLGSGSMGTVYRARSRTDGRWYAVKVLPRRSMWNVRLARRKVRAFEQCKHPAVVPFVDVGTAGNTHYLAWPLVEGETLDRLVDRRGKMGCGEAANYAAQIAEGLEVCHQHGLFHGLLKPSNLMITADQRARILDFGIGCLLAETEGESLVDTMSTANSVTSGLDSASPESILDSTRLTPLGDQYSLGCVLYFCLTTRYPFPDGTVADKMMAHQTKQCTPVRQLNPEVPIGLATVIERLMRKLPEERFASAAEVAQALWPFAIGAPEPETPVPATNRLPSSLLGRSREVPRVTREGLYRQLRSTASIPLAPARASSVRLPTRQTLRGNVPVVPKNLAVKSAAAPAQQNSDATELHASSWGERLGPIAIGVCTFLISALAWVIGRRLF